jgi:hypothetical protein
VSDRDLRASVTRWKQGKRAAALVEEVDYDYCLKRVLRQLNKEAEALCNSSYFRSTTAKLTEEDILDYKPREAMKAMTNATTFYPVLAAIVGAGGAKPSEEVSETPRADEPGLDLREDPAPPLPTIDRGPESLETVRKIRRGQRDKNVVRQLYLVSSLHIREPC